MRYELIIKWFDAVYKDHCFKHYFNDKQEAIDCANGYVKAFGDQIRYCEINPVRSGENV